MPFTVYSLKELIDECERAYLALSNQNNLPISEQKAKARVLAYACNKICDYIGFLGKQIIPTTSEKEYLEAHCAPKGIFRKQATAAYGSVMVKGLVNTELKAGTVLVRKSDNMKYILSENIRLLAPEQEVKVKCQTNGSEGNTAEGEFLDFAIVTAGVESTAIVKLIGSGADVENDKDLLARYLEVVRNVYHGGADSDYVKWALSVEGVNRAWSYPCEMGVGSVTVRLMTPDGFPDTILCDKVLTYIESVRPPAYTETYVVAPVAKKIDIAISGLTPDTPEIRAAILDAFRKTLDEASEPQKPVLLSKLHAAILSVIEVNDYHIDTPTTNIESGAGELAILGEVTWNS